MIDFSCNLDGDKRPKVEKDLGIWCTSYKMAGLQVNLGTPCILIEHLDLIVINGGSSKYRNGNEGTHRWNQRWTRYSSPHSSIVPLKSPLMDKMHSVSPCSSTPTHQMQYYESLELERCLCALGPLGCICIMGQEVQQSTKNMFFFPINWAEIKARWLWPAYTFFLCREDLDLWP